MEAVMPFFPPVNSSLKCRCLKVPFVVVCCPLPYFLERLPVLKIQELSRILTMLYFPTPDCPTKALVLSFNNSASSLSPSPVFAETLLT